jgi:hypothetical protein
VGLGLGEGVEGLRLSRRTGGSTEAQLQVF